MRTTALIKRICQQMLRDKRTLALLLLAPLLILTLMYFLFNSNTNAEPKLGVFNINDSLVQVLKKANINVKQYQQASNQTIIDEKLDGLLAMKEGKLVLTLQNSDPSRSKVLQIKVNQALASQMQASQNLGKMAARSPTITTRYVFGSSETTLFDVFSPILVGFFVFFFVFLISGIGLLRERTTGTLERLMSTPIRRGEVISGYLLGYGIFAVIQTIIVVLYSITVLNISLVGSIWNVLLINLLLAFVALSLGILLSTFAASEFQMVQFIPIVIIPQVFFSGIFPLESMANWLKAIGKIMPIYYGADALKDVMYKGWALSKVAGDILALVIFAAIFIILNTFALKRYRQL